MLSPCHCCPRPLPLDRDFGLAFHYLQFYFRLLTPDHAVYSADRSWAFSLKHEKLLSVVSVFALFASQVPIDTLHHAHIESTQPAGHVQHSPVDQTCHVSPHRIRCAHDKARTCLLQYRMTVLLSD
jgi:hypothetical protein